MVIRELRRADETFLAGQNLDESAEVYQPADDAVVDLADLHLLGEGAHGVHRALHALLGDGGDVDGAVVLDVNLGAGLILNAPDDLAARANDGADLVRIDLDGLDARRVGRQLGARLGQGVEHLLHDEHAAFARLLHSLGHDLRGNALDLDVHLQGRHAVRCARHLEVHVTQRVFDALNVGEHRVLARGLAIAGDEAHGHTRHRGLDRHARVHQ